MYGRKSEMWTLGKQGGLLDTRASRTQIGSIVGKSSGSVHKFGSSAIGLGSTHSMSASKSSINRWSSKGRAANEEVEDKFPDEIFTSHVTEIFYWPFLIFWQVMLEIMIVLSVEIVIYNIIYNKSIPTVLESGITDSRDLDLTLNLCTLIYLVDVILCTIHRMWPEFRIKAHYLPRSRTSLLLDSVILLPLMYDYYLYGEYQYVARALQILSLYRIFIYFDSMGKNMSCTVNISLLMCLIVSQILNLIVGLVIYVTACIPTEDQNNWKCCKSYYQETLQIYEKFVKPFTEYTLFLLSQYFSYCILPPQRLAVFFSPNLILRFANLVIYLAVNLYIYLVVIPHVCWQIFLYNQMEQLYCMQRYNIVMKLNSRNYSPEVIQRVSWFYIYSWEKKLGLESEIDMSDLPQQLIRNISFDVYFEAIAHSDLFRVQDPEFLRIVSCAMKSLLLMEGDIIYGKNEFKDKFIYIVEGQIQILSAEDDTTPLVVFGNGTSLGEATLCVSYFSNFMVRCKSSTCEIHVLYRKDFMQLCALYKKNYRDILTAIEERLALGKQLHVFSQLVNEKLNIMISTREQIVEPTTWMKSTTAKLLDLHYHTGERLKEWMRNLAQLDLWYTQSHHSPEHLMMLGLPAPGTAQGKDPLLLKLTFPLVFRPDSDLHKVRDMIIFVAMIILGIVLPFSYSFTCRKMPEMYTVAIFYEILFILDILFQVSTGIQTHNGYVTNLNLILQARLQEGGFIVDLIAAFPFFLMSFLLPEKFENLTTFCQINQLIKLWKVRQFIRDKWRLNTEGVLYVYLVLELLLYYVFIIYLITTIFYMTTSFNQKDPLTEMIKMMAGKSTLVNPSNTYLFLSGIFRITATFAGDINTKITLMYFKEVYWKIFIRIISLIMEIKSISTLIQRSSVKHEEVALERNKEKGLVLLLRHFDIHKKTRLMIVWFHLKMRDFEHLQSNYLSKLPPNFREEAQHLRYIEYVANHPLFKEMNREEIMRVTKTCQTLYVPSKCPLVIAQLSSDAIYQIVQGYCLVTAGDGMGLVLKPGDVFGVIEFCFNVPYVRSVESLTEVELIRIWKKDLTMAMDTFAAKTVDMEHVVREMSDMAVAQLTDLRELSIESSADTLGTFNNELNTEADEGMQPRDSTQMRRTNPDQNPIVQMASVDTTSVPFEEQAVTEQSMDDESEGKKKKEKNKKKEKKPKSGEKEKMSVKMKRIFWKIVSFAMVTVFVPDSKRLLVWEIFRWIIAFVTALFFPLQYLLASCSDFHITIESIAIFLYAAGVVDMYMRMHVGYYNDEGVLVTNRLLTAFYYYKHAFLLDLFCLLPLEMIPDKRVIMRFVYRFNKVFGIYRLIMGLSVIQERSTSARKKLIIMICKYIIILIVSTGILATLLLNYACKIDRNINTGPKRDEKYPTCAQCDGVHWVTRIFGFHIVDNKSSPLELYSFAFYFATSLVTVYGLPHFRPKELITTRATVAIVLVISTVFFFHCIAQIVSTGLRMHINLRIYQNQVKHLLKYIDNGKVPSDIISVVKTHVVAEWKIRRNADIKQELSIYPRAVRTTLLLDLFMKRVMKNSYLEYMTLNFYEKLLFYSDIELFTEGCTIILSGDVINRAFIIVYGTADAFDDQNNKMYTLTIGSVFGHILKKEYAIYKKSVVASAELVVILTIDTLTLYNDVLKYVPEKTFQVFVDGDDTKLFEGEHNLKRKIYKQEITITIDEDVDYSNEEVIPKRNKALKLLSGAARYLFTPGHTVSKEPTIGDSKERKMEPWLMRIWPVLMVFFCWLSCLMYIYTAATYDNRLLVVLAVYSLDLLKAINIPYTIYKMKRDKTYTSFKEMFTSTRAIVRDAVMVAPFEFVLIIWEGSFTESCLVVRFNRLIGLVHIFLYWDVQCTSAILSPLPSHVSLKCGFLLTLLASLTVTVISGWFYAVFNLDHNLLYDTYNNKDRGLTFMMWIAFTLGMRTRIREGWSAYEVYKHDITAFVLCIFALTRVFVYTTFFSFFYSCVFNRRFTYPPYWFRHKKLMAFLKDEQCTLAMRRTASHHMQAEWMKNEGVMEPVLLKSIPRHLRDAVINYTYGEYLFYHDVFQGCNLDFMRQVAACLKPMHLYSKEMIVATGTRDNSMYFIVDGVVIVNETPNNMTVDVLYEWDSFGLQQGVSTDKHDNDYIAYSQVLVLVLKYNSWSHLAEFYPQDMKRVRKMIYLRNAGNTSTDS